MMGKKRSGCIRDLLTGLLVGLIDEKEQVEDATLFWHKKLRDAGTLTEMGKV